MMMIETIKPNDIPVTFFPTVNEMIKANYPNHDKHEIYKKYVTLMYSEKFNGYYYCLGCCMVRTSDKTKRIL